jgi:phosphatidylserine decarboxylase
MGESTTIPPFFCLWNPVRYNCAVLRNEVGAADQAAPFRGGCRLVQSRFMVKDAYPFLIPLLLLTVLLFGFEMKWLGLFFLLLSLFIAFFFRDPERKVPVENGLVVSPADGRVVQVLEESDRNIRVSIFLSVFDVHVNRAPIAGAVESVRYFPGKFKVAFDAKASTENEQNVLVIDNGSYKIKFSQVAGILARRIVCWKKPGDVVSQGERVGLIKFGSRVDVLLPESIQVMVKKGEKVQGGSSIIGRLKNV